MFSLMPHTCRPTLQTTVFQLGHNLQASRRWMIRGTHLMPQLASQTEDAIDRTPSKRALAPHRNELWPRTPLRILLRNPQRRNANV